MDDQPEITDLFERIGQGDLEAKAELFALAMELLRQRAHGLRAGERSEVTFWTDDLLGEVYCKDLPAELCQRFEGLPDFVGWSTVAMRRILIDRARARLHRPASVAGDRLDAAFESLVNGFEDSTRVSLLDLEQALGDLRGRSERHAQVLDLYYFGSCDLGTIGERLGVGRRRAQQLCAEGREEIRRFLDGPA